MDVSFSSQTFRGIQVPLLWGSRAVLAHPMGEFSVIDLSGAVARPEVIKDLPAPGIEYIERGDGIVVFKDGKEAFFYSSGRRIIKDIATSLPDCEIRRHAIRVGTHTISSSMISGFQVGIGVDEGGMFIGGPLPPGLAALRV